MRCPDISSGLDEAEHLSKAIAFALDLGWDALVAAKPKRQLLLLSHDDRMEIYRGFEGRLLADKLIGARILASLRLLPYWMAKRRIPEWLPLAPSRAALKALW